MAKANPGETWGYRVSRKTGTPLTPVEVIDLSKKRRVVVRHLEGPNAGEQEEGPLQRIVVPWEEAEAFMEDERRLIAVYETPWGEYGETELDAVLTVANGAFDDRRYSVSAGDGSEPGGVLTSGRFHAFAEAVGMTEEELLALPNAYRDRTGFYRAPFVAAVEITKRYCQHDPRNVLDGTELLEDQLETFASTAYYPFGMPISHGDAADILRKSRPALDLLRSWCGADALEEWDEVASLRAEINRLQELIEDIAFQIGEAGNPMLADRLRQVMLNRDLDPIVDILPEEKPSNRRHSH